jgi:hypothetical protein
MDFQYCILSYRGIFGILNGILLGGGLVITHLEYGKETVFIDLSNVET